jgi:DNA-binding transcriptional MerR regulator
VSEFAALKTSNTIVPSLVAALTARKALDSGPYSRVYPFNMPLVSDRATSTMQIGEVAKLTALTVDAIRYYERRALLPKTPRTAGRFRLYTNDDVARLDFIRQMQGLGFSLIEIRQLLELREQHLDACLEVRDLLKTKLKKVRLKILDLEQLEVQLALDLVKCNRELKHRQERTPRNCPILISSNGKQRRVSC